MKHLEEATNQSGLILYKSKALCYLVVPPGLQPVEPAAAPAAPRRGGAALGEGGGGRQHQRVGHVHAEPVVTNFIFLT